jgi:hypothetical protein
LLIKGEHRGDVFGSRHGDGEFFYLSLCGTTGGRRRVAKISGAIAKIASNLKARPSDSPWVSSVNGVG